ncbi:DUF2461 domain-containing protein [candidate division CSSED10-310 bacterium]|uniref:DUF2461 domain-containing protein n=1 Tax=candidate division CSSED10-310 bacterium TaxID=2855610 RepID=A0ABV6YT57_UNCC1
MNITGEFDGFNEGTVTFFADLLHNNTREWFADHKEDHEDNVVFPARLFIEAMGERLKEISPAIIADPRVNKSLFRINRDTRFSKDKQPYKTNLAIWFWEGEGKRMECSGFYFHLDADKLMLGTGIYMFEKPYLEEYRKSVIHPTFGPQLADAIEAVEGQVKGTGACALYHGERYKRVPAGYDPKHKYADLLLNKGLTAFVEGPIPKEFYSKSLLDYASTRYKKMAPVHHWLVKMVERAKAK